ncbi:EAL domain-containing protein [Bacillus marasmi]|uniref:EAL domain-containing protein n=1 Tax=Bacillus marasmi TaxID=1926279 RepID=UPI0011C769E8|nr:EAL domain-containing protein [Bacillus marasmi]
MTWHNKLAFRFWLAINSLVLTGIISFSAMNLYQESSHLENALRNEGTTAANTLNSAIGLYMLKEDYSQITPLAYSLLTEPNIAYVRIKDIEGNTVIQKGNTSIDKEAIIIEKVPLEYFQENVGEVEIALKTDTLHAQKHALLIDIILLTISTSIVSLVISYLITRRLALPINRLILATKQMIAGNRQVAVEEDKIFEIQQLAIAFNDMTKTINNHEKILVEEINKATKDLSDKVSTLEVLQKISSSVLSDNIERTAILKNILTSIKHQSKASRISLAIKNKQERLFLHELDQNNEFMTLELDDDTTAIHRVMQTHKVYIHNNLDYENLSYFGKRLYNEGMHSLLILPIIIKNKPIGTFNISCETTNFFTEKMVETLSAYTSQIALALDRIDAYESLQYSAYHDYLTGLPNYRLFKISLNSIIKKAKKNPKAIFAVIFLDLDRFKMINDTLGHANGDILLKQVGNKLESTLDKGDMVTRFGGDEFSILLPNIESRYEAIQMVEKIIKMFETPFNIKEYEIPVSASIGVAFYPTDGLDAERLIKNADRAMYRVKEHGKKSYAIYESQEDKSVNQLVLENDLRKALERNEFVVYYQPKINIKNGTISGLEALVRWNSPHKGIVFPGEFIPFAEENGLIVPIGEFVLREACNQSIAWQKEGMLPIKISINLSTRQLLQSNLHATVAKIINESGIQPELIELEITESMTMDIDRSLEILNKMKQLGVKISVDDFGTGYSSLNYLRRLPIDRVKIDQSFIRDMTIDSNSKALVSTIITMAQNLKLSVTAEGVEKIEQVHYLQQHLCDEIQGYYFSKPLPADEFQAKYNSILQEAKKWKIDTPFKSPNAS